MPNILRFRFHAWSNNLPACPSAASIKPVRAIDAAFENSRHRTVSLTFGKERKRLLSFIRQRIPLRHQAEYILQDVFEQFTSV